MGVDGHEFELTCVHLLHCWCLIMIVFENVSKELVFFFIKSDKLNKFFT